MRGGRAAPRARSCSPSAPRASARRCAMGRCGVEMVENRPFNNLLPHLILWIGIAIVAFPVYLAFVGSTHEATIIANGQMPLTPGSHFLENYYRTIFIGTTGTTRQPVATTLINSSI